MILVVGQVEFAECTAAAAVLERVGHIEVERVLGMQSLGRRNPGTEAS